MGRILLYLSLALLATPWALAVEKSSAELSGQVDLALHSGKIAEAERLAAELVKNEPANASAWRRLARCQMEKGSPQQALDSVDKAIALDPGNAGGLVCRADVLSSLTRDEDALKALRVVLGLKTPVEFKLFGRCADIARGLEDYELALKFVDRGLRQEPESAGLYGLRGRIYWGLNKLSEADASLTKALQLRPDSAPIIESCILVRSLRKDYAGVIAGSKLLSAHHELKPAKLSELYRLIGNAYFESGQYQKAVDEYTLAIKFHPIGRQHFKARAAAYARLGQKEKEQKDLATMRELEDTFSPLRSGIK